MTTFTQDDVQKLREFGKLLIHKAQFSNLSISEIVAVNKYLQFYNELTKKVEDSILEVVRVTEPESTVEPKSSKKK